MSRYTKYKMDPRWITARFDSKCDKCGAGISKGADAFYYPNGRQIFGKECGCGDTACADFEASAQDEMFMTGGGW